MMTVHGRALLVAALSLLVSCETVKPWQRGAFVDPAFQAAPCPDREGLRQHVRAVREGTKPTSGGSGAGCGCH